MKRLCKQMQDMALLSKHSTQKSCRETLTSTFLEVRRRFERNEKGLIFIETGQLRIQVNIF